MTRLEGWKGIAAYLSEVTGLEINERRARDYAKRATDPLPVVYWLGSLATADQTAVHGWAQRQWTQP